MLVISINPQILRLGPFVLGWHGVLATASFVVAYFVIQSAWRARGLDPRAFDEVVLLGVGLAFIGGKLPVIAVKGLNSLTSSSGLLGLFKAGMVLYGALAGFVLSWILFARWKRISFWNIADAFALGLPLSQVIARWGCLILGDIYGLPTSGSWGVVYQHPNAAVPGALLGVPLYPVVPFIALANIPLLVIVLWMRRRVNRPGILFLVTLSGFALIRLIASIWEPSIQVFWKMNWGQVTSLLLVVIPMSWLALRGYLDHKAQPGASADFTG